MSAPSITRSRAFFLEIFLDLVILVFCTIICLQVLAQAHSESSRSAAQTQLGIQAQQLAELFKGGYCDADALATKMEVQPDGNTLTWYFDADLVAVDKDAARYTLRCTIDDSQRIRMAVITLSDGPAQLLEYRVSSNEGFASVLDKRLPAGAAAGGGGAT